MFRFPLIQHLVPNTGEAKQVTEKTAFLPKTFFGYFLEKY